MIPRLLTLSCLSALIAMLAGSASAAPPTRACSYGASPAEMRAEGYCTAQLALRSTIARSLGLLEARMSAGEGKFATDLRLAQDLRAQQQALAAGERAARAEPGEGALARVGRIVADAAAVETRLAAVESRIAREHPRWLELTRPEPLGEAATRALLRPGEVLLFWSVGEDSTFVWAVDRAGADWGRIAVGARGLGARVAALRAGLGVDGPSRAAIPTLAPRPAFDRVDAASLYELLFPAGIRDRVAGAHTLLLVPTGPLTSLPFAALPVERGDSDWLGLSKALAILPSPNSLRALRMSPGTAAPEPFAGFGAPLLSGNAAAGGGSPLRGGIADPAGIRALPALPQTEAELHQLARALGAPASSVHVGAAATEAAVRGADLARYRILAFATHGLLPGEADGLDEAGLVFTPPVEAREGDDGVLTASEAAQLRLAADWVILSACSTAAGGRPGSESLSGLASAFTYAGARALLVSQWRVDDEAARRLTTLTVSARGIDRAEALRRAMATIAADPARPGWADPSIWAVFELVGDPRGRG